MNRWLVSALKTREADRGFFVEKAAQICEIVGVNSLEDLISRINTILIFPEYNVPACSGIWSDISSWNASRDAGWMLL